jgi:hypothetical protein
MLPPCDTAVFSGRCIFLEIFGSFIYFSKIKVEKIYKKFSRSRAMEGVCPSSPPRRHSTPALGRHLAAGGPTLLRLGLQRRRSGATLLAAPVARIQGLGLTRPLIHYRNPRLCRERDPLGTGLIALSTACAERELSAERSRHRWAGKGRSAVSQGPNSRHSCVVSPLSSRHRAIHS